MNIELNFETEKIIEQIDNNEPLYLRKEKFLKYIRKEFINKGDHITEDETESFIRRLGFDHSEMAGIDYHLLAIYYEQESVEQAKYEASKVNK